MKNNKKIVVGITPKIILKTSNDPYEDRYEFLDLYSKRIIEAGGIPVGICLKEGTLDESTLDICDAFLIPGGSKVDKCHFEVIKYAIENNKPLLGICCGFQALAIYSVVSEALNESFTMEEFFQAYQKKKMELDGAFLKRIPSPNIHGDIIVNYENTDSARHEVNILYKASYMYEIYQKENIKEVSLHSYTPKKIGSKFKVTGIAFDNEVEAIEYLSPNHFILGVSYHPEWDQDNLIFTKLIKESELRK